MYSGTFIPAPWAMEGGRGVSTMWGFGLVKRSKKDGGIGKKNLRTNHVKVFYPAVARRCEDGVAEVCCPATTSGWPQMNRGRTERSRGV